MTRRNDASKLGISPQIGIFGKKMTRRNDASQFRNIIFF